jgi:predicted MFS family arabinose efflux permease
METESATVETGRADGLVLAALCVASFLAALNFYAATPFYSRMARDLATTVPLLGQVATLMILISASLVLLLAEAWVAVAVLVVASVASAVAGIAIAALLAAESPAGTGTTMVLNGSLLNLGAVAGTALGGVLIAVGGYAALGVGLPVFALIAAALAWWPADRR